jgi:hypothetical protein
VNPYHTPLSWVKNETELVYWLGGLITGGIAPQLSEFGGPVTMWDSVVRQWLTAYRTFGHMIEGGITTLVYDRDCCHVEGECEWEVCQDVIASRLEGGTGGGPAAGVYVGVDTPTPTAVPAQFSPENSTVLVFAAWNTRAVQLTIGDPLCMALRIIATSSTPNCTITLTGGFLSRLGVGASIAATEYNAAGTVTREWVLRGRGDLTVSFSNAPWQEVRFQRQPPPVPDTTPGSWH